MKKLWAWVARNERHLSAAVFLGGFVLDNIALGRIDLPWVEGLYGSFLIAAALLILFAHYAAARYGEPTGSGRRPLSAFLMLGAQFFIGGLLSGCLIFYARGAAWSVSWPFLFFLVLVFFASEFLHSRKERLEFQVGLFYLSLYLYSIFALPIALGKMGSWIFIASGAASAVLFAGFLGLLWVVGKERLMRSVRRIAIGAAVILALINVSYFTGILPPLPLSLSDAGIYHALSHTGSAYEVEAEDSAPAWQFWRPTLVHAVAGEPLYAYSAVFAPVKISTDIVHVWQQYTDGGWTTVTRVAFPIQGGRDGGYRGYSESDAIAPGPWRLSVETQTGQVIGREYFTVIAASSLPPLHTQEK